MPSPLPISLIQMSMGQKPEDNLQKAVEKIRTAAKAGAKIISVSELFNGPYFCQTNDDKFFKLAEPVPGPTTKIFSDLSKELGVVLIGSVYEVEGTDYYNTAFVIDSDGKYLGKYRKLHIPDDLPNHYSELYYFKPGNLGTPVFKTKFGTIGVLVCWDQWFPEAARAMAEAGAQILFYPTAIGWPRAQRTEEIGPAEFEAWQTIQRSHAIANGVFVASCNRVGKENHLQFWGGSFICDPLGVTLATAGHDEETILSATLDLNRINEVRADWPFLACRRLQVAPRS